MAATLPYAAEYAKTGRASCKGCKNKIDQGSLRLAAMVQSAFFDGKQANWYHEDCFFQKQRPKSASDIGQLNTLRSADKMRITETIEKYGSGIVMPEEKKSKGKGKGKRANADAAGGALKDFAVEYSKSSRAACRVCELNIIKNEIRICKIVFDTEVGQKYGGQPLWHHVKCFAEDRANLLFLAGGESIPGFDKLSKEDQKTVKNEIKPLKTEEVPIKKLKEEPKDKEHVERDKALKSKMEAQNNLFYKYRDGLSDYAKGDLVKMIEANNMVVPTGIDRCLVLVADSMAFGVVAPCSKCKHGQMMLDSFGYICTGDLTEWTKCQYHTTKPDRKAFKVPKKFKQDALFKKFKGKVDERLFEAAPPSATFIKSEAELSVVKSEKPAPPLKNLYFFIYGKSASPKEQIKNRILKLGGKVASKLGDHTIAAVISTKKDVEKMSSKMEEIRLKDLEVVEETYLDVIEKERGTVADCLQKIKENNIAEWGSDPLKRLPQDVIDGKSIQKSGSLYTKSKSQPTKLKLKGGTAVDPDSMLEDVAHVYKDIDGTKWTVVLGLTDIVAQKNSYYKLQVLESDEKYKHGPKYWLFRSWGRIGTKIGGNKIEDCKNLKEALKLFEDYYKDKTDNTWDCRGILFRKVPGKMYPIDVDYGEEEQKTALLAEDVNSKLPTPVQKLIMRIFNVEEMKKVLLEFELDTEKMPLGKLSKKQIKSGFSVLSELLKYISDAEESGNIERDRIIDATNRFYTLVPHNFGIANPPLLQDIEAIKNKTLMLDSLLEIEIAYNLLNTDTDSSHSPIEAHYKKLKAEIAPIDHASSEFELIQKYVRNTHAKTHSQYTLDIQQVYQVVREGEDNRFKPFKKLHNRCLLWHGSRVTNFAGILSQGLRIAPPEAPPTGYMFGKGIYFADMVSKSANYCNTSPSSPVGILMLCEVALGNMKECYRAENVTKLPPGTHSVWGKGRTIPDPAQAHKLECGTIVPLGQAIEQKESHYNLLYNEFIVYDVAQVKVKYLMEMKFNYKF